MGTPTQNATAIHTPSRIQTWHHMQAMRIHPHSSQYHWQLPKCANEPSCTQGQVASIFSDMCSTVRMQPLNSDTMEAPSRFSPVDLSSISPNAKLAHPQQSHTAK